MATPYITPEILINAPTGISWETIPDFNSDPDAQLAEQTNICWRATHWIDSWCNQPLRATIDTEEILGPNYRLTVDNAGLGRFLTSRWPVTEIISGQYTSAWIAPPQWNQIPSNAMYVENALNFSGGISIESAAGPSAIIIVPGYVSWAQGRRGYRVSFTYVNGWAHAGIVSNVNIGDTEIQVDDCTGMFVNSQGRGLWIYDGNQTEYVTVASSSVASGPGTVTLTSPTLYAHSGNIQQPILMSSLPASVQEAAILHATYQALTRGATATTVQNMPGLIVSQGTAQTLLNDVKDMLKPYRRVL